MKLQETNDVKSSPIFSPLVILVASDGIRLQWKPLYNKLLLWVRMDRHVYKTTSEQWKPLYNKLLLWVRMDRHVYKTTSEQWKPLYNKLLLWVRMDRHVYKTTSEQWKPLYNKLFFSPRSVCCREVPLQL